MSSETTIVAIDMGYGHLRPARSIAKQLGQPVMHVDRAPLADEAERARWASIRAGYERVSRLSNAPLIGTSMRVLLETITDIPSLHPLRDLSRPNLGTRVLSHSARGGLGRSLVSYLHERNAALLTTFYSPAILADFHGYDRIYCVVTDSDVNRVWAPIQPQTSKVHYFAPSGRVVRRLRAYGVSPDRIELTGFPLPHSLVGGAEHGALRANLAARLARLDPRGVFREQFAHELAGLLPEHEARGRAAAPPHLVFAVGGAGAQADLPAQFLPRFAPLLRDGRLRLTLVAGVRREVLQLFSQQLQAHGLSAQRDGSVEILFEPDLDDYFDRFDELLAHTDVLWTKPSEMVFYAGLGIPLLLSDPIGVHEAYNRRFARENGVALKQRDVRNVGDRLLELLDDGHLAAAAWSGYRRVPHLGLYRIAERLARG